MKSYFLKCFTLLSILLLLLFSAVSYGQINASKGVPSFTNYVVGDLSAAGQQVWDLGQDKFGYLYVGTSSGLQRFDGVNWELLSSPIQDFNTNVRATYLSTSGTYYYGSIGDFGYISSDSLGNTILKSVIEGLPEDFIFNDIWTIREAGGDIYFQAREAIFIYTPETENEGSRIRVWKPDTSFMYGFSFEGRYYAHQMDLGLFRETNKILELIPGSDFLGEERVQVLLPHKNPGEFLVGAFAGGLYLFDGENFKPFKTDIDSLLQVRSLYKALALPNNTYAMSILGHGFFIIDQDGKALSQFTTKNSIPDQSVYSFFLDNTQNLWVGTNAGLSKIELFSPVTRFDSDQYEVGNLLSLNAYGEDLYIGGSTTVLYIDKEDGLIKPVKNLPNTQVFDLEDDGNQVIATGVGLYEIRGDQATIVEGTEDFQSLQVLISKKHEGYVIISGNDGIHVLKRSLTGSGKYLYEVIGQVSQVQRSIYSLMEDAHGEIWGGTQAGILYRVQIPNTASGNLDVDNSKVTEYSDKDGVRGLSGQIVDVSGRVYTSGIDGFYYFDHASESFIRDNVFSFSDEVADINLDTYGLGANQFGNVTLDFIGEKRLALLQPDSSYILQEYPYNLITASFTGSGYTEPTGIFWFGTDEGLLRVDPNSNYKTDYPTLLYFNSVVSGNDKLILPEFFENEVPELEYKGNKINFKYISPFFVKENRMQYQTFLEGLDEDWTEWESKTNREFSNLPYGTYSFRVRAKNTFNTISDEITYNFVILPPWYATWWAFILYFIAFGLLVYALVRFQTGRVLAREKNKNRDIELAHAKEIEKAYQDLKNTQSQLIHSEKMASLGELTAGIAHEIQNPLNFVNNFSEVSEELIDEMKEEYEKGNMKMVLEISNDLKENLSKIKHHGKRADSIVKGMLAHSRSNTNDAKPTNINALAEEFLRLSYHGLRAKDKSFNADFDSDLDYNIPEINVVGQDVGRVILNLINNAFYACADRSRNALTQNDNKSESTNGKSTYNPKVIVQTRLIDLAGDLGGIEVCIKDNGGGIPKAIKDKIFQPFFTTKPTGSGTGLGLSISYDIIKAHGGDMRVKSIEGEGTEMIIFLPIHT
ncbi:sensor histidine kinase [Algoriphagus chordae]|uniref:histidine kinase n=1 Tax=Algoriphagus chordae TaxID=237019 RepID=A0A2W7RAY1_9BACT|nr:ATP-binding protein [Algoriphagus chordae]PZX58128.1 signal transduction histidine kinase [Algoriphagus chordae]